MEQERDERFSNMLKVATKLEKEPKNRKKRSGASAKELKFEISEEDSALKQAIIGKINESNLTYGDLYKYCSKLKGDEESGSHMAFNIIGGLKNRHTMLDNTFLMLADFLNCDVYLVKRDEKKEE